MKKCFCGKFRPYFGYFGDKNARHCSKCKKEGMINIKSKTCFCGMHSPYFGYLNDKRPGYCSECKKNGMQNIVNKKCFCNRHQASFGYPNDKTPGYCSKCKKDGMVNIKNKKCFCGMHYPIYGYPNDKTPGYCSKCKKDGMKNIRNKKCFCRMHYPIYGYPNDKTAGYCSKCKKDGMQNITSKKCFCGMHYPSFGYSSDKTARYCSECKKDGMEIIRGKKCPCGTFPSFGYQSDKTPRYCLQCKKEGMVDIKHKKCKTPLCDVATSNKMYRGYCSRCFYYTFPNEKLTRNYKVKENMVSEYIEQEFPQYSWKFDRRVQDGCSKKRPDVYCDFGKHILVQETDENKHSGYNCENKRMMQISKDFGHRPVVFIRFNPDSYFDKTTGKKKKSCFVVKKKTGKLEIRNKKEWKHRLDVLKETIAKYAEEATIDKTLTIIQLFYE